MTWLLAVALQAERGQIVERTAENGMSYFLRVPAGYDAERGAPAFVFLHGSNMNGRMYLETIESCRWLADYILVGPNGEQDAGDGAHNFTFDSAPLVVGVYDEVARQYRVTRAFVGGHSQGGFLTYSVFMTSPDRFAGAMPMAGGLWMQCEPSQFREEELEPRRRVALAILHGRADPVVDFDLAESAHFSFLDAGFPAVRLFAPATLGHQFALSPVPQAVAWLELMSETDPDTLLEALRAKVRDGSTRDACLVLGRLREAVSQERRRNRRREREIEDLAEQIEESAREPAEALSRRMEELSESWVRDFWSFRERFGLTETAGPLLARYDGLRREHDAPAERLFWRAREAFGEERRDDGYAAYEEICARYWASRWYFYARRALDRRDAGD